MDQSVERKLARRLPPVCTATIAAAEMKREMEFLAQTPTMAESCAHI
jgi:hypothetical protein